MESTYLMTSSANGRAPSILAVSLALQYSVYLGYACPAVGKVGLCGRISTHHVIGASVVRSKCWTELTELTDYLTRSLRKPIRTDCRLYGRDAPFGRQPSPWDGAGSRWAFGRCWDGRALSRSLCRPCPSSVACAPPLARLIARGRLPPLRHQRRPVPALPLAKLGSIPRPGPESGREVCVCVCLSISPTGQSPAAVMTLRVAATALRQAFVARSPGGRTVKARWQSTSAHDAAQRLLLSHPEKKCVRRTEVLDGVQLQKLSLTLGRRQLWPGLDVSHAPPPTGTPVPPGYHLAYFTPAFVEADLGPDGTDKSFNPPAPFTRRMCTCAPPLLCPAPLARHVELPRAPGSLGRGDTCRQFQLPHSSSTLTSSRRRGRRQHFLELGQAAESRPDRRGAHVLAERRSQKKQQGLRHDYGRGSEGILARACPCPCHRGPKVNLKSPLVRANPRGWG